MLFHLQKPPSPLAAAEAPPPAGLTRVLSLQAEQDWVPVLLQADCTVTSQTGPLAFRLPSSLRQRICATFDAAGAEGGAWQRLARSLGLER